MSNTISQHRTQVYLPNEVYKRAKVLARQKNISLAQVIRDALGEYTKFMAKDTYERFQRDKKQLLKLAGLGKGPKDLSRRHDDYW